MARTAEEIIRRQAQLEKLREPYQQLKQLSVRMSYPMRADVWDIANDDAGKARGHKIYDPTACKGLEIWGNGILGNYAPKDINWFQEILPEQGLMKLKSVRRWLQDTDDHLRFTINRSNYHEQKRVAIMDSAGIGDSGMFIDEDQESGKIICITPHPRELWFKRDMFGRLLEIHHKFKTTLQSLKAEFGDKALSDDQKRDYENKKDTEVQVIHAIDKNPDYDPSSMSNLKMRWRSVYVSTEGGREENGKIISEGGYRTLNPIIWSLNRPSHEIYGRGIVSQILIEILTANYIAKDMLLVSQLAARPPMLMTSAIKNKLDMRPGAKNFYGTQQLGGVKVGDLIARLVDTSGYPFGIDMLGRWQTMIDQRFGVPLFLAMNLEDKAKTATEVRLRQGEKITLLSPFLATLGTTTDAELDRIYDIELMAGRAPIPPLEVLEASSGQIDIQYIGPLHQLLKQYYETGSLLNTIANIQAALSVAPDSAIVVEGDELMRKILRSGNAPEEIILSQEDVAEIRAMQAEVAEQQMQAEVAERTLKLVPGLQKASEQGSPLSQLEAA